MTTCPSCDFKNIAGTEICEKCGQDLLDSGVPTPQDGIQKEILATPLRDLEPVPCLEVEIATPVAEAMKLMRERKHGSVVVRDGGKVAGIFTERDVLMKVVMREIDPEKTPVGNLMTAGPQWLKEDDPLAFAIHLMAVRGFRHIPVVQRLKGEKERMGIVSIRGIIGHLTKAAL